MARTHTKNNKKLIGKTIIFGALSLAMYTAFFMNSALLMTYFTKGMAYAALPILAAFGFTFVHATFAGNVWQLLGIEASKKQLQPRPAAQPRPTAQPRPVSTERPRPRVYMNT